MASRSAAGSWARPLEIEEDAQRLDQALAPRRAGGLLQEHRGLVQQLGQHRPGDRVHLGPVGFGQIGQLAPVPLELRLPQGLEPGPQRRDDRRRARCRLAAR